MGQQASQGSTIVGLVNGGGYWTTDEWEDVIIKFEMSKASNEGFTITVLDPGVPLIKRAYIPADKVAYIASAEV